MIYQLHFKMINKGVININIKIKTSNLDEVSNLLSSSIQNEKRKIIIEEDSSDEEKVSPKKDKKVLFVCESDSDSDSDKESESDEEQEIEIRKYKNVGVNVEKQKKGYVGIINKHMKDEDGLRLCPFCTYKTANGSTLSMHISRIHPIESCREISPHMCGYCGKGYQASTNLQHHIKTHHEITYHNCRFRGCNYKAKNTTTLANHISAKHLKKCFNGDTCLCCKKYIGSSIKYHVAICCPLSPLFKNSL